MVVLSVKDAATRINCTEETVRRYIRAGQLPSAIYKGRLFVRESDLIEVESHAHQAKMAGLRNGWEKRNLRK